MKKIKIKPELLSLLTSDRFKQFTSQALIKAYQGLPTSANLNQRQVQQFIFRNLERLESAGIVTKKDLGDGRHGAYRLTEKFTSDYYGLGTPHCKDDTHSAVELVTPYADPLLQLKEQLNSHKFELLTTIAETEEYETLCQKLPSKQLEIQELYNDARDRYSKTLGKVKAIESLILRTERIDS